MNKKLLLVIPVVLALAVAGCGKKKVKTEGADVGERGVVTGTAGENGGLGGVPMGGPVDRATQRRVHFEFDSASIDDVNRAIIAAHAAYLVDHAGIPVTLEGHADERGTREYNLALGERRAKAVAQMMQAMGVAADRISVTSYGEERPLALGHNESAWQLNRRVEIIYADQ
jgi:peptidoglycan-associated lipoprotein